MKKRPFGRTGLEVSELVFGGGFVGGILLHADDDTRREAIRRALDGGINWIDTAASYGDGKSEEALNWLLAELPADRRPHLSSKFRVSADGQGDMASQIERSLEASLTRLGMEHVDLFQLHNPVGEGGLPLELVLGSGGVCDVLDRLKSRGAIRHAGFTALGETAACLEVIRSGRVESAQVYYNMINPTAGYSVGGDWSTTRFDGLIDACTEHGVAVMNIRTFAGGALASPQRHGREVPITLNSDHETEVARAEKVFSVLGEKYGTRAQTALRFSLSHLGISCVVFGLAELAHLDEALAAAEMGPLPEEAIAKLIPLWNADFA
jgi:D-threo-aldose 1-dehydrogenase